MQLARRQRETVSERLGDFFESARDHGLDDDRSVEPAIARPVRRDAVAGLSFARPRAEEAGDSILSRLNKLTSRQKRVLELLAEGLPNKVIAHELGISETTVKAHVGEILRKLKVYNRARAIVMLAQFDMGQSRALPRIEGDEAN